jgi:predicted nucleic acid-binding Zn ribbon protein
MDDQLERIVPVPHAHCQCNLVVCSFMRKGAGDIIWNVWLAVTGGGRICSPICFFFAAEKRKKKKRRIQIIILEYVEI